jgi:hypothetical protein
MRERDDGRYAINTTLPPALAAQVREYIDDNPEMTESRLLREGIRRQFQHEENENSDE